MEPSLPFAERNPDHGVGAADVGGPGERAGEHLWRHRHVTEAQALVPLSVDPVHFSSICIRNMGIAPMRLLDPCNLYVRSTISDTPAGEVIREILLFLILLLIAPGAVTCVPWLTMGNQA